MKPGKIFPRGADQRNPVTQLLKTLSRQNISYLDLIKKDTLIEKVVHLVLEGKGPADEGAAVFNQIIQEVRRYPTGSVRTVVFGGGTGLSSIVGGDTESEHWALEPFVGLKRYFSSLQIVVCMTDDGGSSGKILQYLPCIALGDIRRAALSAVSPMHILSEYPSLRQDNLESLVRFLQKTVNYRFTASSPAEILWNPLTLIDQRDRPFVPRQLVSYLTGLGKFFSRHPVLNRLTLQDQCLGNLWLVAAVYRRMEKAGRNITNTPSARHIVDGINEFSKKIGAGAGTVCPAATTQGELQFLYSHGVVSSGEHKSSLRHSSFPVQRVWTNYIDTPQVDPALVQNIRTADLIILAPGSVYTSILPILQLPALSAAVRANKRALKILGASFWAQRGETDLAAKRNGREYHLSDLIEAYHTNIPGGIRNLFDYIIVTDLHAVPGDILRNYALEGKIPIYLDHDTVARWGVVPIKAALSSEQRLRHDNVIQHDPQKFARVIKTLYVLRDFLPAASRPHPDAPPRTGRSWLLSSRGYLCEYMKEVERCIAHLEIGTSFLKKLLKEIVWNNREILIDHLRGFKRIRVVKARSWSRSTEWDNVLGYFDPTHETIYLHESLLNGSEERLIEDLLIAIGESLLGNYFLWKHVRPLVEHGETIGKLFELRLRNPSERRCFLSDRELKCYLRLAQLSPSRRNRQHFTMVINGTEAFTPPGLLFGLVYAWYLNNARGEFINHEMSIMQWKISQLIPKQSMERERMQNLIAFFRRSVFRQHIPKP